MQKPYKYIRSRKNHQAYLAKKKELEELAKLPELPTLDPLPDPIEYLDKKLEAEIKADQNKKVGFLVQYMTNDDLIKDPEPEPDSDSDSDIDFNSDSEFTELIIKLLTS